MSTSEQRQGKLKEYELLRQELLHHDRAVLQVIGLILGFLGIITAQGLTSGNPYVFIVPLPVLVGLNIYVSDKRWAIWLIASYLQHFVEKPGLGPSWETDLHWFRTACRRRHGFTPGQNVILVECWFLNILGLLELGLFAFFAQNKSIPLWQYSIPTAFCGWLLWQTINQYRKLVREGREGATLDVIWQEAHELSERSHQDAERAGARADPSSRQ